MRPEASHGLPRSIAATASASTSSAGPFGEREAHRVISPTPKRHPIHGTTLRGAEGGNHRSRIHASSSHAMMFCIA